MRKAVFLALSMWLGGCGLAEAGDYAPLDCDKAKTASEHAICNSYRLGQDEARMATLYAVATSLVAMGQRGDLGDTQRRWLQKRDACGKNPMCLKGTYASRIGELDDVIKSIASRGPF